MARDACQTLTLTQALQQGEAAKNANVVSAMVSEQDVFGSDLLGGLLGNTQSKTNVIDFCLGLLCWPQCSICLSRIYFHAHVLQSHSRLHAQ